ncbi:hypothetical protein Tco_0303577 [Tanacetum coccineum]
MNTRSTMEAEFLALDKVDEEAEWLRSFLKGIPLWSKLVTAVCRHCDGMAILNRAKNHIYNGKSRHVRRRHNMIKDLLRNGIITIDYIKSKENIDNPLTKGLCKEQVIFTSSGEYYGIFLIGITYTRLMCGGIFGNQMAKVAVEEKKHEVECFIRIIITSSKLITQIIAVRLLENGDSVVHVHNESQSVIIWYTKDMGEECSERVTYTLRGLQKAKLTLKDVVKYGDEKSKLLLCEEIQW